MPASHTYQQPRKGKKNKLNGKSISSFNLIVMNKKTETKSNKNQRRQKLKKEFVLDNLIYCIIVSAKTKWYLSIGSSDSLLFICNLERSFETINSFCNII